MYILRTKKKCKKKNNEIRFFFKVKIPKIKLDFYLYNNKNKKNSVIEHFKTNLAYFNT